MSNVLVLFEVLEMWSTSSLDHHVSGSTFRYSQCYKTFIWFVIVMEEKSFIILGPSVNVVKCFFSVYFTTLSNISGKGRIIGMMLHPDV